MRISFSNIAWDTAEDEAVAQVLHEQGVDAIDIAPAKYFPHNDTVTDKEIATVRDWWGARGITIVGMQALMFGTTGLNMFGADESRSAMLSHLASICRIGSCLGATKLVFGSPRNRDRSGLEVNEATDRAVSFFRTLGDIAQTHGVEICLEPNPPSYGANFMIDSTETAHVVNIVSHPAIRMQLDTGAMFINGECAPEVIAQNAHLIGHIHASEPQLSPLGDQGTDHRGIREALMNYLPKHILTIEMLATSNEPHLAAIQRALAFAKSTYQVQQGSI